MRYTTAVALALAGIGVLAGTVGVRRVSSLVGVLVLIVAAAGLAEHVLDKDLGITHRFADDLVGGYSPRMPLAIALAFVLAGLALLSLPCVVRHWQALICGIAGSMIAGIGALSFVTFLFQVDTGRYTHAVHASLGILIIGLCIIALAWRRARHSALIPLVWPPLLIAGAIVTVSVALWQALLIDQREHVRRSAQLGAIAAAVDAKKRLDVRVSALEQIGRRWQLAGPLPSRALAADAAALLQQHPGYSAIEWLDARGNARWTLPADYDDTLLHNESWRHAAAKLAQAAGAKGHMAVERLQLPELPSALVVHVPLMSDTRVDGYLRAIMPIPGGVARALGGEILHGFSYALLDGDKDVFTYDQGGDADHSAVMPLDFQGLGWRLRVWRDARPPSLPYTVLGVGILLALIAAWLVYLAQAARRSRRRVETANAELRREIAERRRVEAALLQGQRQLAAAEAIAHVGSWEWDVEKNESRWSDELYRIYGLAPQSLNMTYEAYRAYVHPEDREANQRNIERALAEGQGFHAEFRIVRADGAARVLETDTECLCDDAGKVVKMIGVCRDVTDRRAFERQLQKLNQELEARVAERTAALEAEVAQRKLAEESARRREQQQAAVAGLGQAAIAGLDMQSLMERACRAVAEALGVELTKVLELMPDREHLRLRAGVGWSDGLVGQALVGAGTDSQAGYTLLSPDPVIVENLREERRFRGPALLRDHGVVSGISAVIGTVEQPFGVLGAHTRQARAFSVQDIRFLQAVANVLGAAVERLRAEEAHGLALEREQAARSAAESAEQRASFLAQASAVLASSLHYQGTLASVAQLSVPEIADWCVIDLLGDDGRIKRVKVAHTDPAKQALVRDLQSRYPPEMNTDVGAARVLRTGQSEMATTISDSILQRAARDAGHLAILRGLGFKSYMCVPLIARERVLGAISFVSAESGRQYGEADLRFAEELARRCALAVDNASLYLEAEREIVRRMQVEELLAAEKEQLAVTLQSIGDGVITTDTRGTVALMNKVAEDLTGWAHGEAVGRPLTEVFRIINEKTRARCENPVEKVLQRGEIVGLANHTALIRKDGKERTIADSGAPIRDRNGKIIGVVLVFRDVTESERVQAELQKTQKLESIGVLAGGIAHDFNNILTAILGNIALARLYAQPGSKIAEVLGEAENAFGRARDLTQQLLTFSRGGAPMRRTASIADLLRETTTFVLRGSNVRAEFAMAKDLWPAKFDVGQMSQVINNLVINAKQAMPEGGVVRIEAENVELGARHGVPLRPGRYVCIRVADNGVGIPEEHLNKIFDPYFTTKQAGSGLGLATSYSIVKKHDGHLEAQSRMGEGACFTIYLPASFDAIEERAAAQGALPTGQGRVLLMDDEESIRRVGGELLKRLGYEVAFADDGEGAVEMYKAALLAGKPFKAVILDLTIPGGLGGVECLRRLAQVDPGVRAIVSSGYSNDPVMAQYQDYGFRGVIAKPYQLKELSETVHRVVTGDR